MEWQELLQEVQVGAFPLLEGLFEAMAVFNSRRQPQCGGVTSGLPEAVTFLRVLRSDKQRQTRGIGLRVCIGLPEAVVQVLRGDKRYVNLRSSLLVGEGCMRRG